MALTFENWVKFTATHNGRDKLMRWLQYASKLVAYQLAQHGGAAALPAVAATAVAAVAGGAGKKAVTVVADTGIAQLQRLSSSLSAARKLFRFGKFAENFRKSYDILKKLGSPADLTLTQAVSLLKQVTTGVYLVFDSLQWIHDSGVRKSPQAIQMIKDRRQGFYALSIFFTFLEGLLKLRKNQRALAKEQGVAMGLDKATGDKARTELGRLEKEQSDIVLEMTKNALDLPIPLGALKYLTLSDGVVGALGTVTSTIAVRLAWASLLVPKAK